jgi:hypothetical protein
MLLILLFCYPRPCRYLLEVVGTENCAEISMLYRLQTMHVQVCVQDKADLIICLVCLCPFCSHTNKS